MKTPAILLIALASSTQGFAPVPLQSQATELGATSPFGGMFKQPEKKKTVSSKKKASSKKGPKWIEDLIKSPMHGHGSAESDLDEIYADQKKVLNERKKVFNEKKMRSKYKAFEQDHLRDIPLHKHDPKDLNLKEDDDMWIDETQAVPKYPWDGFRP